MTAEDEPAGTPEITEGELAEAQETPAGETSEDRTESEPDWKQIALGYKSKVEKANQEARELDDLRTWRAQQQERTEHPPAATDAELQPQEDEIDAQRRVLAKEGDVVALGALRDKAEALEREHRRERNLGYWLDLQEIDDKTERAETKKEFKTGRYADIDAARQAVKARNLAVENEALRAENARFKASKPAPDTVRTAQREAPSSNGTKTSFDTGADYDAEMDRLVRAGKQKQATQLSAKYALGQIKIKEES